MNNGLSTEEMRDVTAAFSRREVFLTGEMITPRDLRRRFIMVRAQNRDSGAMFELSVDFRQPQGTYRFHQLPKSFGLYREEWQEGK